jgi:hypothetical protein
MGEVAETLLALMRSPNENTRLQAVREILVREVIDHRKANASLITFSRGDGAPRNYSDTSDRNIAEQILARLTQITAVSARAA